MEPENSLTHSQVRNLSLSWASLTQSIPPHASSWWSNLILSSHLSLGLPGGLVSLSFPTKSLYMPLFSPIRPTCPNHLNLLNLINQTIMVEHYISLSSSFCTFLHYPVTSSLLGPNILLSTLFSDILSLHSSLKVSDQFSHPQKTADKINVLYTCLVNLWAIKLIV